jgi:HEPN domain-containing protein
MNVEKQIAYWRNGAEEDFDAAKDLVDRGRFRHGLFFAHLAVEKMLKAHVVKATSNMPPRIHNLVRLRELAGLRIEAEMDAFFRRLNAYQLEGRYAEMSANAPISANTSSGIMSGAEEALRWLTQQL